MFKIIADVTIIILENRKKKKKIFREIFLF